MQNKFFNYLFNRFTYIVVVKIRNSINEELKVVARELLSN